MSHFIRISSAIDIPVRWYFTEIDRLILIDDNNAPYFYQYLFAFDEISSRYFHNFTFFTSLFLYRCKYTESNSYNIVTVYGIQQYASTQKVKHVLFFTRFIYSGIHC